MRLGEFILHDMEGLLCEWDAFAETHIPAAAKMTPEAVRDHAKQILVTVAKDISTPQTKRAQADKSKGLAPEKAGAPDTAAETHAVLRAKCGFDINELAAEYRALRANVLRRWMEACRPDETSLEDAIRFNEAIDQSMAESIDFFSSKVDQARNLMLGMLTHDMRSPLTAILMTASYLGDLKIEADFKIEADVSAAASLLIRAGKAMNDLLDDMVDFKRTMLGLGIRIALADIDLGKVLTCELEQLRAAYPKRRLELEVVGDTQGRWDGHRLQQMLRNLIANAIQYGAPNTPIRTAIVGQTNSVRLEVTNSGPTIEQSALDQIFDPLQRCSTAGQGHTMDGGLGLGLGLHIVREVARAHGGDVDVRSAEGITVFDVRLPRRKKSSSS